MERKQVVLRFEEKAESLTCSSRRVIEGKWWAVVRTHLRFVVVSLKWDNPRGCVRSSSGV